MLVFLSTLFCVLRVYDFISLSHSTFFSFIYFLSVLQQSLCDELTEECKFATNCCGPVQKPVKLLPAKITQKLALVYGDMMGSADNNYT